MSRLGFGLVLALLGAGSGVALSQPSAPPGEPDPAPGSGLETVGLGEVLSAGATGGAGAVQEQDEGPPYNGQFTFVRIRFGEAGSDMRNMGYSRRGRWRDPPWRHDYPRAERNFAKIVEATTFIDTYTEGNSGRILTLDDPEFFKYPISSIIEVGDWRPSDEDIANLRAYLLKGGFLIVDDTRQDRGYEYQNFAANMKRALPEYDIQAMPDDHKIFDSFFFIEDPHSLVPPYGRNVPMYMGIFEDNDPVTGRIMVMINFNQDLQEYWEFSDQGYYPIDLSNEAYQFGVNYLIYAFTH